MRPAFALAVTAVAVLALAACSGSPAPQPTATLAAASPTASPTPTASPSPTVDPEAEASAQALADAQAVTDALAATRAKGTAQGMFWVTSTVGDTEWTNVAEGGVELLRGYSRIGWMSPTSPSVTVMLVTPDGNFVRVGGEETAGGQWLALADGQTAPLLAAGHVFRGLDGVPFVSAGAAQGGEPGTVYTATLPLDAAGIAQQVPGMGISTENPDVISTATEGTVTFTVVVGEDGLISEVGRYLTFAWSGGQVQASSEVKLIGFGTDVNLTPPPAKQVQPAPETM